MTDDDIRTIWFDEINLRMRLVPIYDWGYTYHRLRLVLA